MPIPQHRAHTGIVADTERDTMMNLGYTRPLYLLPFDHCQSCVTGMFQRHREWAAIFERTHPSTQIDVKGIP